MPRDYDRRAVMEKYVRHIYAVYLGIRSCAEISATQNDRSYLPEVSVEQARQNLRLVDAGAREIGIDSARIWSEEAPVAVATAEALKTRPETHLVFCQRMSSLFRVDAGSIQAILNQLGAKSSVIPKDF